MGDRLLTRAQVEARVSLSCSAIYRLMRKGRFPAPIQLGPRAVRWKESELQAFIESRPRATGEGARVAA